MVVMTWKEDIFRGGEYGGYLVDSGFLCSVQTNSGQKLHEYFIYAAAGLAKHFFEIHLFIIYLQNRAQSMQMSLDDNSCMCRACQAFQKPIF